MNSRSRGPLVRKEKVIEVSKVRQVSKSWRALHSDFFRN